MILNESQLSELEELAGLFLEPEEIAVLLGIDADEFKDEISNKNGPVWLAYFKGRTVSKKEIHANVVKLAKHGSPQAEELVAQMIQKQLTAEKRARR